MPMQRVEELADTLSTSAHPHTVTLNKVYNDHFPMSPRPLVRPWEQGAIMLWRDAHPAEFWTHARVVRSAAFNTPVDQWDGEFIAHYAGGDPGRKWEQLHAALSDNPNERGARAASQPVAPRALPPARQSALRCSPGRGLPSSERTAAWQRMLSERLSAWLGCTDRQLLLQLGAYHTIVPAAPAPQDALREATVSMCVKRSPARLIRPRIGFNLFSMTPSMQETFVRATRATAPQQAEQARLEALKRDARGHPHTAYGFDGTRHWREDNAAAVDDDQNPNAKYKGRRPAWVQLDGRNRTTQVKS